MVIVFTGVAAAVAAACCGSDAYVHRAAIEKGRTGHDDKPDRQLNEKAVGVGTHGGGDAEWAAPAT